jgi:hypothetical protein
LVDTPFFVKSNPHQTFVMIPRYSGQLETTRRTSSLSARRGYPLRSLNSQPSICSW